MASLSLSPLGVSWWSVPVRCPLSCCQVDRLLLGPAAEGRCTMGLFRGFAGEAAREALGLGGMPAPEVPCMPADCL